MPTYEYACTNPDCGHRFSQVQAFSDNALSVCPVCDGRLRKVFGAVGVVFKGSGFYRNDSRAEASKGASAKTTTAETKSDAKADSKSDSTKSDSTKSDSTKTKKTETASTSASTSSSAKAAAAP